MRTTNSKEQKYTSHQSLSVVLLYQAEEYRKGNHLFGLMITSTNQKLEQLLQRRGGWKEEHSPTAGAAESSSSPAEAAAATPRRKTTPCRTTNQSANGNTS
jgi:hypothetical protein